MAKRANVLETITVLIVIELAAFLVFDSLFAFGFISYFQTGFDPLEGIYLRTTDCAGCDVAKLDALVSEISKRPNVQIMVFENPDQEVIARAGITTLPSLTMPYDQYTSRSDVKQIVEKALVGHEDRLVGGVLFGNTAMVLTVPFALYQQQCGEANKVFLDYFSADEQFSNANEPVVEKLQLAFGDRLVVRRHAPDSDEASKYQVLATPTYILNCKYKKIGAQTALAGADAEFATMSKVVCSLLSEKPAFCS